MQKSDGSNINYFSYVKKDDEEMMAAIFGRENIKHENATLHGYELCIQTAKDIIDTILPTCKEDLSPKEILTRKRGPNFELYTIRPNPNMSIRGVVWYVTNEEYEHLREYELIDCGMSDDIVAEAVTEDGKTITISTYGLDKNVNNITKVVDEDYKRPEISKEDKMKTAKSLRA